MRDKQDTASGKLSRRSFLKSIGATIAGFGTVEAISALGNTFPISRAATILKSKRPHIAVVGAGVFGGWTALFLQRLGAKVTLFDAWGPGNARASSGGDTRVIRAIYGPDQIYVEMVARAFELWFEHEKRWQRQLYTRTGALWMLQNDDGFVRSSLPYLSASNLSFEELNLKQAGKSFPQIHLEGVKWVFVEKEAGYISARESCRAVLEAFLQAGGDYHQLSVMPMSAKNQQLRGLALSNGDKLRAEHYVFACGPWLGKIFPNVLGNLIKATRQEVFYFGPPAGNPQFTDAALPVWVDFGERIYYGIPGAAYRGFKIADDTRGQPFDPTHDSRLPSKEGVEKVRAYLGSRFPRMKQAPLLEARVCQYENSPDHHFILDKHPAAENVWIVGGGSGHGFKHAPAVGERMANMVLGKQPVEPFFSLSRFNRQ